MSLSAIDAWVSGAKASAKSAMSSSAGTAIARCRAKERGVQHGTGSAVRDGVREARKIRRGGMMGPQLLGAGADSGCDSDSHREVE